LLPFQDVGNLWNLGEFPAEFDEYGKFKEAPNTWISGISDAEPGNLMLSDPQLGGLRAFVAACQSDLQNAEVSTRNQRIAAGTPTSAELHPRA
jgi:hypothetical protein